MKNLFSKHRAVDSWLFALVPPHALALFRIFFGMFLLILWLRRLPFLPYLFANGRILPPLLDEGIPSFLSPFPVPPSPEIACLLYIIFLSFLVFFILGFYTRTSAFVSFLFSLYYWFLAMRLVEATYDRLFIIFLFILSFSGAGMTLSWTMRHRHGSWWAWEPIVVFPQRLIAIQVTMTYLGSGWQKAWLPGWQTGEVIYYMLIGMRSTRFAHFIAALPLSFYFYEVMSGIVKLFEFILPVGLWSKSQRWFFLGGAIFHILVTCVIGMWWFLALIATYILFIDPEKVFMWFEKRFPTPAPLR